MYPTMNSWNGEYAPAYNMKVYNIVEKGKIQDKIYDLMSTDGFWAEINNVVYNFDDEMAEYGYCAGFNGRSGGYLVLYKKGTCAGFEAKDVPAVVLKAFRRLALDIIATAKWLAKHATVSDEDVTYVKREKVMRLPE